jgi:hypothetical protein
MTAPSLVRPQPSADAPAPTGRPALDTIGATGAIVCAVHCVLVALAVGALPALGVLADPRIDWFFLALSAVVGIAALVPAYLHHRRIAPLVGFGLGMGILSTTRVIAPGHRGLEATLVAAAAACLVWAHWRNRRLVTAHACTVPGHQH